MATRNPYGSSSEQGNSSSGNGSEEGSKDTNGSSDSEEPLSEGELEFLKRVNCPSCSRPLLSGAQRRGRLTGKGGVEPSDYVVCDGCRRCFHEHCCKRQGIATEPSPDGTWYHSPGCKRAADVLSQQASKGPTPLSGDRSWQVVPLKVRAATAGKARGDVRAPRKQQLHALLDVLAPEYGPGVADQLLDSSGYALLLTKEGAPIAAATLDVYGQDFAAMDLFTTAFAERGRGHGAALLHAAEQLLGSRARVKQLLAVAATDEKEAVSLMQRKFGFSRLNGRQTRKLCNDFPALQYYEHLVLLSKDLSSAARAAQLKAATSKSAASGMQEGGGQPAAAAGVGGGPAIA